MPGKRWPATLAALVLTAGMAHAQDARLDDSRMFSTGEEAWNKVCSRCHSGHENSVGPNLLQGSYDEDIIRFFARHGSGPMPAFTAAMVDDTTLSQIAAYVIANHKEPAE
ncbi:cytochrome c [Paracoccus limosus]|jgi:mono/diheme cytochrome c family protein|uniref:Cytochrome c n=1 Tax=Paracoccus limosus TaxID=913252 RepID=A0A844H3J6_9RHOB|nr:cytochrome c [Paracoccus limosus]MTH35499.1 cytochrome c [Paracoccus limosus]